MSLSLLLGWAGILYFILQPTLLRTCFSILLAKYLSSEFVDREECPDSSAAMAGLLPPMSSGRCLVSEVCQSSRERFFVQPVA